MEIYRSVVLELIRLGYPEAQLDLGDIMSRDRKLTQWISRWAFDQGYQGIAYKSRLDCGYDCWALFEGADVEPMTMPMAIARDDPDLLAVAEMLGLTLP